MVKSLGAILVAMLGLSVLSGCGPAAGDLYLRLQNEDPSVRIEAIRQAGELKDPAAVPYLIDRLTDSERDVSFWAILALERTTGKTMGWKYYEPPAKRAEAVRAWRRWPSRGRKDATTQETVSEN